MATRVLLKGGSTSLTVWSCSQCNWLETDKDPGTGKVVTEAQAKQAFEDHACSDYPKKKKREDFSQAAARIVREATKG